MAATFASHALVPRSYAGRVRQWLGAVPGGHGLGPRIIASRDTHCPAGIHIYGYF